MVSIVIVSHSHRLAEGVAELARQMGGPEVRIETAGGLAMPDHPIGTDAVVVTEAVERAWSDDGVLVLMDLGSAVLSAEMAVEFLPEERQSRVLLCEAPLVEGAVAAAVTAKLGAPLADVAAEARSGLASKLAHLGGPPVGPAGDAPGPDGPVAEERSIVLTVENEHGLHARPAARLVQTAAVFDADVRVRNRTAERGPASARSINGVATLGVLSGHTIEVTASGRDAEAALTAIAALARRGFDDEPADTDASVAAEQVERATIGAPSGDGGRDALRGFAVSPGAVVGPARWAHEAPVPVPDRAARSREAELTSLDAALQATRQDVAEQRAAAARRSGSSTAAIFEAHLLFLDDEALLLPARTSIAEGVIAERAWNAAVEDLAGTWRELDDPYLRERASDIESVGRQVLAHLTGRPAPAASIGRPGILLTEELSPAETSALDPDLVLGIASASGGPTSHAAVLARSLGIPAVVGLGAAVRGVEEGQVVALDGDTGTLMIDPSPMAIERMSTAETRRREELAASRQAAHGPALTADGTTVEVSANVGALEEIEAALTWGADGVGLFRTEFLFLGREDLPSEDEQLGAYRHAADALAGRPLVVRTLDVGADKPVPFLPRADEANPFLGVRGLRLGLLHPDVLATQLRALARLAAEHSVRVMFPMVATVHELRAALDLFAAARDDVVAAGHAPARGDLELGVMVEIPAAALTAHALAPLVDFFSIGTNDLTQYALAADRGNARVAGLADAAHPAVLQLIRATCTAAEATGAWVGVCGEAAGDPGLTPLLLGLGVRELSMQGLAIPTVKDAVRATHLPDARALADAALRQDDAAAVRAALGAARPRA